MKQRHHIFSTDQYWEAEKMDSRKSARNLAESLHSLLGIKANLTSNWVKSVCDIIKTLPTEKSVDVQPTNSDINDDDRSAISKTKDELTVLTNHINQLNIKRRQILNEFLDLKGNIRVFCRIRPITSGENSGHLRPVVASDSNKVVLKLMDSKSKSYTFDKVLHPDSSQDEVFTEVEPIIKSVLDGYNACIFAYGQTGTGKTFTMEGDGDTPGIVPRAMEALFKQAVDSDHAFLISFSMLEIYMGNLKDLLVPKPTKATDPMPPCLSIQTDPTGGVEIDNLVAIKVNDCNQALRLYRLGCRFRSTASTNSNLTSSRSHCMIRVAITCFNAPERRNETSKIWLVDLGGSERVLKTKAWGKRLNEGKAINLSLSALGDVISALHRKKHHIPYRNSKLTQVLKDSLGGDSKTIMLVHVSPKEEDLCETICSLNFATRVKGVHLGNEDTLEAKEKKEVAMANLQQKMKHIEDEWLLVKSDIEILNKKLENLTGTGTSSEEQMEAYHSSMEEPLKKSRIVDITVNPLSKLPRFTRPTICSQRKSGAWYQTSEGRDDTVLARRRKPTFHRAESVSFPVKDHSENNSDHSFSRSSCLAGLNMKDNTDDATEYSQDTTESDFKFKGLQEHERASRNMISRKAGIIHIQKNRSRQMNKINRVKFSKIDSWLHLQKSESALSGCTQRKKQVLAVPIPEKKHKSKVESKSDNFLDENVHDYAFAKQIVNHDKINTFATTGAVGKPVSEAVMENPPKMLKDLFNEDSRSDVTFSLQTTGGKTMVQKLQLSVADVLTGNSEYNTFSQRDGCFPSLEECEDGNRVNDLSITKAPEGNIQCSDYFLLKISERSEFCPSELSTTSVCTKRDSGISFAMLDLESCCQQAPTDSKMEDSERQGFYSFLSLAKETRHGLLHLNSALFMNSENHESLVVTFRKPEGKLHNTGTCHVVKQKIEILCSSALLGLGLYDLGFDHNFFYGLML
ncbi:KINESIN-LIKE PROTEIN KLP-3 [Salix viminalis]|uniref:KINESIN-LIKE PROTEIN KLP-3 n=1 Tax=Salix viminalis TaxID=40686 RepID=A0A9Q0QAU4_SALVM|nr:KINESIN-LIKE PROTEIN KLP-3 [Salix viminalis]KAJ6702734.1 KINESIN-LIKE PROTEIN KLP-3 [Salix viminalis]